MLAQVLGSRPMVGHMTLDHAIGVRIPASQPLFPPRFPLVLNYLSEEYGQGVTAHNILL